MQKVITLNLEMPSVQYLCQQDKRLARIIEAVGPISYLPYGNAYAFLIHEIIEQMLSVKAARKIYERLESLCYGTVSPEQIELLSNIQLRNVGISGAKVNYIRCLTNAVMGGNLIFDDLIKFPDKKLIDFLTKFRGIGKWTAKMFLIFVLDRPDVLPLEDAAFLQVYRWLYKTSDCSEAAVLKNAANGGPTLLLQPGFSIKP